MQNVMEALKRRLPGYLSLSRYAEIARILTGENTVTTQDGVTWTKQVVDALKIPGLSAYGMSETHFAEVVEKTMKASSFKEIQLR
jgi:alcohol dehydrogenase class IV